MIINCQIGFSIFAPYFLMRSCLQEQIKETTAQFGHNVQYSPRRFRDEKINEMKDQIVRAKAYLSFAPPGSNSHFVKELKLRIKDIERALDAAPKDLHVSRRFVSFFYVAIKS